MSATATIHPALDGLHPAIARWFADKLGEPSPPQQRGWPAIAAGGDVLIAAPTGSGKTLAAFMSSIDSLLRQSLDGTLTDTTQVVYISPLKALSNDVQKNLQQPLAEINEVLRDMELPPANIRVSVRTGDTTATQRSQMVTKPPHILVTTPESLYILLTSERGRRMLADVRTVIVDEIHALAGSKRGSHLTLSLERLDALTPQRPVRIGLSATQRPMAAIARLLVGTRRVAPAGTPACTIVDEGYKRNMDLGLEVPGMPLEAVCSHEMWDEIYGRLAELIEAERTTLVFVNTRRLAERLTFHLAKRLGEDQVAAHHGSLSKEQRLRAEQKLKAGELKALVATASLELGIDIGSVDLVCQITTPRSISALLQRVGRSGHSLQGTPRGRVFPLTRDDLVECTALLTAVRQGKLDVITIPEQPMDILAQQLVATVSAGEWAEDDLYELARGAWPYRNLTRPQFDEITEMLHEGFSTARGRSATYLHYDAVGERFRPRKGARLAAVTSGGAIPDNADYEVRLEPENTLVGTVNEDWAIESMAGDIFQLGASSWRILQVLPGVVRVEDVHGLPPTIPFWLGEAPARTDEVSAQVSWLREQVADRCDDLEGAMAWVMQAAGVGDEAARQLVEYIAAGKRALGVVPTQQRLVLERFFDESGGMQLILHSPFGGRVNRAWGLGLRKRFCVTFNFELQAAATEDAIILSLGPMHSFPLEEVFQYLHPNNVRDVLIQAVLPSPIFGNRWRWDASRALAVLRFNGGRKVPLPLQRMRAQDLLASVFPDSVACAENLAGPIQVPDHPLVRETIKDCLTEAMDLEHFTAILRDMYAGKIELIAKDTTEPSPFAYEVITARPYAFLDDAPLEERRTQAVAMRRTLDVERTSDIGQLDAAAIERVLQEAWPQADDADELHDALMLTGYLTESEGRGWQPLFDELRLAGRATRLRGPGEPLWVAAERLPMHRAVHGDLPEEPAVVVPLRSRTDWTPEDALRELLRGRLEACGPVTVAKVAGPLGVAPERVAVTLQALEAEGFALRGSFTPGQPDTEWCDRRLLARIHRYTLDRLRREVEPVNAADYMRFLLAWHKLDADHRMEGVAALVAILETLEGFEAPVTAWEDHILPARLRRYSPTWIDELCLSGEVVWGRVASPPESAGAKSPATRQTPVALLFRENLAHYPQRALEQLPLSGVARELLERLQQRGACFFQELQQAVRQLPSVVEDALGELVTWGLVTSDTFAGLRTLTAPARKQSWDHHHRAAERAGGSRAAGLLMQRLAAGRWSLLQRPEDTEVDPGERTEFIARQYLRRYGVVFHRMLLRESDPPPWRDLVRVYRRLEARGEIRGGRFINGFTGEQYALPGAVEQLRALRRAKPTGEAVTVCGNDPLNLVGIVTPGNRIPSVAANRITYRDGVPVSATIGGQVVSLLTAFQVESALALA